MGLARHDFGVYPHPMQLPLEASGKASSRRIRGEVMYAHMQNMYITICIYYIYIYMFVNCPRLYPTLDSQPVKCESAIHVCLVCQAPG